MGQSNRQVGNGNKATSPTSPSVKIHPLSFFEGHKVPNAQPSFPGQHLVRPSCSGSAHKPECGLQVVEERSKSSGRKTKDFLSSDTLRMPDRSNRAISLAPSKNRIHMGEKQHKQKTTQILKPRELLVTAEKELLAITWPSRCLRNTQVTDPGHVRGGTERHPETL